MHLLYTESSDIPTFKRFISVAFSYVQLKQYPAKVFIFNFVS